MSDIDDINDPYIQENDLKVIWRGRISLDEETIPQPQPEAINNENVQNRVNIIQSSNSNIEELRSLLEFSPQVANILGAEVLKTISEPVKYNTQDEVHQTHDSSSSNQSIGKLSNSIIVEETGNSSYKEVCDENIHGTYKGATFGFSATLSPSDKLSNKPASQKHISNGDLFNPWALTGGLPNFMKSSNMRSYSETSNIISTSSSLTKRGREYNESCSSSGDGDTSDIQTSRVIKRARYTSSQNINNRSITNDDLQTTLDLVKTSASDELTKIAELQDRILKEIIGNTTI